MSVYGYTRLNTSRQAPEGMTLNNQSKMIRQWAGREGVEGKRIFRDRQPTSASLDLPRLEKLQEHILRGDVSVLVIARLDRLTRSIRLYDRLLDQLHNQRVRFVSVQEGIDTKTSSGKLALQTMRILGRWEAMAISDRTREMIERKRKIGERVGHAPFGYVYQSKKLVPLDEELAAVELIRNKRQEERLSYHRIAKFLNDRNIPSKRGKRWYAETVKTICESPLYGMPSSGS